MCFWSPSDFNAAIDGCVIIRERETGVSNPLRALSSRISHLFLDKFGRCSLKSRKMGRGVCLCGVWPPRQGSWKLAFQPGRKAQWTYTDARIKFSPILESNEEMPPPAVLFYLRPTSHGEIYDLIISRLKPEIKGNI